MENIILIPFILSTLWISSMHSQDATQATLTRSGRYLDGVKRSACKEDETFVECAHCGPETCAELGRPKPCTGGTAICKPQCVCADGHVRNANGTCILEYQCPDCGGDKNATSGCGDHCGRSCSDYLDAEKKCLTSCLYNRCDCKDGYVFHDSLGICVLPSDC